MHRHVDGQEDRSFRPAAFRPTSPTNSSDLELENVLPEDALQTQYKHTQQQGVTYLEHWGFAMGIAYRLWATSSTYFSEPNFFK